LERRAAPLNLQDIRHGGQRMDKFVHRGAATDILLTMHVAVWQANSFI